MIRIRMKQQIYSLKVGDIIKLESSRTDSKVPADSTWRKRFKENARKSKKHFEILKKPKAVKAVEQKPVEEKANDNR